MKELNESMMKEKVGRSWSNLQGRVASAVLSTMGKRTHRAHSRRWCRRWRVMPTLWDWALRRRLRATLHGLFVGNNVSFKDEFVSNLNCSHIFRSWREIDRSWTISGRYCGWMKRNWKMILLLIVRGIRLIKIVHGYILEEYPQN